MSYHLRPRAGTQHTSVASSPLAESVMFSDQEISATAVMELLQSELGQAVNAELKELAPADDVEKPNVEQTLAPEHGAVNVESYDLSQAHSKPSNLSPPPSVADPTNLSIHVRMRLFTRHHRLYSYSLFREA